jgi:predicted phage tail protein
VKEFWTYTGLRVLLFAASVVVVGGIWLAAAHSANVMWVLIISLVISGVASFLLLGRQRTALAQHVNDRARRASERFEEMKTREDVD